MNILDKIKNENKHVIKILPTIEEVTKDDLLTSIPDYSLGLFLTYLNEKNRDQPLQFKLNRFEKDELTEIRKLDAASFIKHLKILFMLLHLWFCKERSH